MRMSDRLYDTRFFVEYLYSGDKAKVESARRETTAPGRKWVSAITIHELFKMILEKEGREVAKHRIGLLHKTFKVKDLDFELAVQSADLRKKYSIPMADSMIAATSAALKAECVTDDPHFSDIRELNVRWI